MIKDFLIKYMFPLMLAVFPLILAKIVSIRLYWAFFGIFIAIAAVYFYPKFEKYISIQRTARHETLRMCLIGTRTVMQHYSNVPVKICFFRIKKKGMDFNLKALLEECRFVIGDFSLGNDLLNAFYLPCSSDLILTDNIRGFICFPVWCIRKGKKILVGGLYIYVEAPNGIQDVLFNAELLSFLERTCRIISFLI